jgi:hypothetical protein
MGPLKNRILAMPPLRPVYIIDLPKMKIILANRKRSHNV